MTAETVDLKALGVAARAASVQLAVAATERKNAALEAIVLALRERQGEILAANRADLDAADEGGLDAYMKDRLMLDPERLEGMAAGVRSIAGLPDPVGEVIESRTLPNGLHIERRRTPLGVIGVIYESRPNVTIDIAALCMKAGNAVILRGGSESINSNTVLSSLASDAMTSVGLPGGAIQFVRSTDRALVMEMLAMNDVIDLLIPRGSASLVRMVAANATMPAVTGGIGVCHTYVDRGADLDKARESSSMQRSRDRRSATHWTRCLCTPTWRSLSCRPSQRRSQTRASRCAATGAASASSARQRTASF